MLINVVTIFPDFFTGPLSLSIPARAVAAGAVQYRVVDLRNFTHDKHRTVDDYPYGGGAGMVMKPEPFFEAVAKEFEQRSGLRHLEQLRIRGVGTGRIGPLVAAAAVARHHRLTRED